MPLPSIPDFDGGKADLDYIKAIATSDADTATDRFGTERRTIAGSVRDLQAPAVETAAFQAKLGAEAAQAESEAAADVALARGKTYPDAAAGVNPAGTPPGVAHGEYFTTPGPDGISLLLWLNAAGTAVLQVGKDIPAASGVKTAIDALPRQLASAGVMVSTASDGKVDFLVGRDKGVGFGYDLGVQDFLVNDTTLSSLILSGARTVVSGAGVMIYTGTDMVPLVINSNLQVVSGSDAITGETIAPNSAVSYSPAVLESLPVKPTMAPVEVHFALGESTSVGATAIDLASTTQPYNNTTFAGGPRGDGGAIGSTIPLVEVLGPASTGETSCSAAANRITELAVLRGLQPSQRPVFAFTAGKGSTRLDEISKGTAWYNGQITNMITSAKALNPSCAIHYVELMTGINNAFQGTLYAPFLATAEQLQVDLQQLVQSITGQTDPVYFLCHQPSYYAATHPDMAYALLDLEKNNPMFFMLDPSYNLPGQPDQTHFPGAGSAWMGLRTARAADQIVMDGKKPNGIRPISATFDGTRVRLRCKVPTPPLVLDTLTMLPTTDMGFRLVDASGTVPISSIVIENGTDVMLTPGRAMTGTRTLRYAADYLAAGILIKNGASGNLRDSTPGLRVINGVTCYLYRICPHFPPMTIFNAGA